MFAASIPLDLLLELAHLYDRNPAQFFYIPAERMTSAVLREGLAELRNSGYLEEEMRGVVRFTTRGYKAFQQEQAPKKVTTGDRPNIADLPAWA